MLNKLMSFKLIDTSIYSQVFLCLLKRILTAKKIVSTFIFIQRQP